MQKRREQIKFIQKLDWEEKAARSGAAWKKKKLVGHNRTQKLKILARRVAELETKPDMIILFFLFKVLFHIHDKVRKVRDRQLNNFGKLLAALRLKHFFYQKKKSIMETKLKNDLGKIHFVLGARCALVLPRHRIEALRRVKLVFGQMARANALKLKFLRLRGLISIIRERFTRSMQHKQEKIDFYMLQWFKIAFALEQLGRKHRISELMSLKFLEENMTEEEKKNILRFLYDWTLDIDLKKNLSQKLKKNEYGKEGFWRVKKFLMKKKQLRIFLLTKIRFEKGQFQVWMDEIRPEKKKRVKSKRENRSGQDIDKEIEVESRDGEKKEFRKLKASMTLILKNLREKHKFEFELSKRFMQVLVLTAHGVDMRDGLEEVSTEDLMIESEKQGGEKIAKEIIENVIEDVFFNVKEE